MVIEKTALLQLVALTLPAVGIYMQLVYSETNPEEFDSVEQGSYHQGRLSIIFLIFSGILLLTLLIVGQVDSVPAPDVIYNDVIPIINKILDSVPDLITKWVPWIISLVGVAWIIKSLVGEKPTHRRTFAFSLPFLILMPVFVQEPISILILYFLGGGLSMFAGMVAFGRGGRQTETPIYWGLYEGYNHLAGSIFSKYSHGNRLLEIPTVERIDLPKDSCWVAVPRNKITKNTDEGKTFVINGEKYRIEYKGSADNDGIDGSD